MRQTPDTIDATVTVTELRANTSEIIKTAESAGKGVLLTKTNDPCVVLVSFDHYMSLVEGAE